jgi:hypothetical protein
MDVFRLGSIAQYDFQTEPEATGSGGRRKKRPPQDPTPGEDQVVVTSESPGRDGEWLGECYAPPGG